MTRSLTFCALAILALGATAGCGGERPPPYPVEWTSWHTITCTASAEVCTGGRDMTGTCVAPIREDPFTPAELTGLTPCGQRRTVDGVPVPDEATQGAAECLERYCGCEGTTCEGCTATFVAFGGVCPVDSIPPPDPIRGGSSGSRDAGAPLDAGGMDGGVSPPPPTGRYQIHTYEWGGGPIATDPFIRYDLPAPFTPPVQVRVQGGLLWMIANDGTLAAFDVMGRMMRGPISLGLARVTGFDFVARTLHPGTWIMVGAGDGVRLYSLSGATATERGHVAGMFVTDFTRHQLEVLRDDAWVAFTSTMPDRFWVVPFLEAPGSARPPAALSFAPAALTVEPVDAPIAWPAGEQFGSGRAQRWATGAMRALDPSATVVGGRVLDIGGAEYFDDACIENNMLVVATESPTGVRITPYTHGNLAMPHPHRDLPGTFAGLEVRHEGQDIVAFAVTASPSTIYAMYPSALGIDVEETRDLPADALAVRFTVSIDTTLCRIGETFDAGGVDAGAGRRPRRPRSSTVFFHVVVRLL